MNRTRRNHIVQRAYLKRFGSGDGMIWRYDDRNSNWRRVSLKAQAGVVEGFYPDHVEEWLATYIEQPAVKGLKQLVDSEIPLASTTDLRLSIAYYLAVQVYRTPAALEQRWGPALAQAINRQKDKLGKDQLVDHLASLLDEAELDAEKAGFAIPMTFDGKLFRDAVTEVVRFLLKLSWSVGIAPDGVRLVTTDDPVVPGRLQDGRKHFLFPLSRRRILVGISAYDLQRAIDQIDVRDIPARDVRRYNSHIVSAARRYVYATRSEAWVAKVRAKSSRE